MLSLYEKTEPANINIFLVNVLYYQQIIFITTINFLLISWKYINWLIVEMKMATLYNVSIN